MTISTSYPLIAPIIARATPVFPDVGSMMVLPLVSVPSSSACWIMLRAILSLMLPVGLNPSTLAYIVVFLFGLSLFILTKGVLPIVWRIFSLKSG